MFQCPRSAALLLVLFSSVIPGFPQAPPVKGGPQPPIPETVLFRFFFIRVNFLESSADRLAAAGKDSRGPRSEIKNSMRLTDSEESLLKEIASTCTDQDRDFLEQNTNQAKALRQQSQRGGAERVAADQAREQLESSRDTLMKDCIGRLRNGIGPSRFERLVTLVRASEGPRIKSTPVPEGVR